MPQGTPYPGDRSLCGFGGSRSTSVTLNNVWRPVGDDELLRCTGRTWWVQLVNITPKPERLNAPTPNIKNDVLEELPSNRHDKITVGCTASQRQKCSWVPLKLFNRVRPDGVAQRAQVLDAGGNITLTARKFCNKRQKEHFGFFESMHF